MRKATAMVIGAMAALKFEHAEAQGYFYDDENCYYYEDAFGVPLCEYGCTGPCDRYEEAQQTLLQPIGGGSNAVDDPNCPNDNPTLYCHFQDIEYNSYTMDQMNGSHVYFLIINWINFLAPSGYWALWTFLVLDPITNILPFVTEVTTLIAEVSILLLNISNTDCDGNGTPNEVTDVTCQQNLFAGFANTLSSVTTSLTTVTGLFTWPILAGLGLSSMLSLTSYWPIVTWYPTEQGGAQPFTSNGFYHNTAFMWWYLIFGAGVPALMFIDTTALGKGSFNMTSNGLIFIVSVSLYGLTIILNFMNFDAEVSWHTTMVRYQSEKILNDPELEALYSEDLLVDGFFPAL